MNVDLANRIASVVITAMLAILVTKHSQWVALVIGFGFAHYLLSFYYAGAGIRVLFGNPYMYLPLASLSALFAVVYFLEFPLEVYFGIHHACNEGYLKRHSSKEAGQQNARLAATRALFHLAAYFILLRHDAMVGQLPDTFLWVFLVAASLIYFMQVKKCRDDDSARGREILTGTGVELMILLLIGISFFLEFTFLQLVMYHFVLWTLVPIQALKARGSNAMLEYGLLSVGLLGLFITLTMTQLFSSIATLSFLYSQFIFWSYVHITTSFALSVAHPQWIVKQFRA